MLGRCNTADVLAKKGWPHNATCSFCDGPMEDAIHLLATCPFMPQIWHAVLRQCGLPQELAPCPATESLSQWAEPTTSMRPAVQSKKWSALVQLVWWSTWNERNARIFRNQQSPVRTVVERLIEEASVWRAAGRGNASSLLNRPKEPD